MDGYLFDGQRPIAEPARLEFLGREVKLSAGTFTAVYPVEQLLVSPRTGHADRFIYLPDGKQFQCADGELLDDLPAESRSERFFAWLEERWYAALMGVAVVAAALLAGYFYGLPAAAEWAAARIPAATEQALGRQVLSLMDKQDWVNPTILDADTQQKIREGFEILRSDLPAKNRPHLEFRNAKWFGPNAFALPGGTIVLTDAMVQFAETPEEVMAVLAHEIAHVELRHTLRSLIQNSAIALVAAAVTADAASLSIAVASLPVAVAQTKYSREFEADADTYAFALMKNKGYSPEAFASLMERMLKKSGQQERMFGFLSTHPDTEERIKRAREAAGR